MLITMKGLRTFAAAENRGRKGEAKSRLRRELGQRQLFSFFPFDKFSLCSFLALFGKPGQQIFSFFISFCSIFPNGISLPLSAPRIILSPMKAGGRRRSEKKRAFFPYFHRSRFFLTPGAHLLVLFLPRLSPLWGGRRTGQHRI